MPKRARVMRFIHYQTWTYERAVPACDPTGQLKVSREGQLSPNQAKVTCGSCIVRMREAGLWTID